MRKARRVLSFVLSLVLVLGAVPMFAQAAPEEPLVTILTMSDFQSSRSNDWDYLEAQFSNILEGATTAGVNPDYLIFGGDFTSSTDNTSDTMTGMSRVKKVAQETWSNLDDDHMLIVQGNHDATNTTGLTPTGAYYYDDFIVYVICEDDFPTRQDKSNALQIVQDTTNALKDWLDEQLAAKETRPILITSHTGLHYDIDRTDGNNQYASILFEIINEAAVQLDIAFFFGHNHTNGDERVGGSITFYSPGETLDVCTTTSISQKSGTPMELNFTYMNYGYVGYIGDIFNQPTDIPPTNLLVVSELCVFEDRIEVNRYSQNGLEEDYSNTIVLKNHPEWIDFEERTLTLEVNGGLGSSQQITRTGVVTLMEDNVPTKTNAFFTGWTENQDGTGQRYKVGDSIRLATDTTLYAQWLDTPEGDQFVLTTSVRPGKQYLLVWKPDDGSETAYVLSAEGGPKAIALESSYFVVDSTIIIPDTVESAAFIWNALWNQSTSPATGYLFQNTETNEYLCHEDATLSLTEDPLGTRYGETASSLSFPNSVWNYTVSRKIGRLSMYNDLAMCISFDMQTAEPTLAAYGASAEVTGDIYLFEKEEPAQYRWELTDTLESGGRYLIVNTDAAGAAQALTITGRTVGSMPVNVNKTLSGKTYIDYTMTYGDAAVFYSYQSREGNFWLDSWNSIGNGGVLRLNNSSISVTSNHGSDDYYFRFGYEDGALVAYDGLAGTATRTLVYSNGFKAGYGNNVYLYKLVEITGEEEDEGILGDVNQDNAVDSKDARLVLQFTVGSTTLTEPQKVVANVNGDITIDSKDARGVLQMAVS